MSNRQIRLSDQKQIRERIKSFLGKPINIVRADNMVFYGVLENVMENKITLINMRLKKMTVAIDKISELYIDSQF